MQNIYRDAMDTATTLVKRVEEINADAVVVKTELEAAGSLVAGILKVEETHHQELAANLEGSHKARMDELRGLAEKIGALIKIIEGAEDRAPGLIT